jgi:TonB family protein
MSRLSKQCFFASAGLHLILLAAVIFGAGFLPKKLVKQDMEPFHMMPASVIESLFDDPADVQGEPQPEPVVEPVQPAPEVEQPQPEPEPIQQAEPDPAPVVIPEPVKPEPIKPEPKPEAVKVPRKELPKENTISKKEEPKNKEKPVIKISTVIKKNTTKAPVKTSPEKTETPAPVRRNPASDFDPKRLERVGKGSKIKGVTTVFGSALGNYGLKVQSAFDRRWTQSENLSNRNATVQVRVVVGTDGSIVSARVVKESGVASLDQSIERLLDIVTRIPEAPPAGASLSDRTFTINFNIN